jgi:hypothetical protein
MKNEKDLKRKDEFEELLSKQLEDVIPHNQDLTQLTEPLNIEDIDFRVQRIYGRDAILLAYKDARVDMNRLDKVVGSMYWKREMLDNNTRCRVSIYNKDLKEWIGKEDVGTPSATEKEKGLASDSFKRACFNWGIGRELYDYPIIKIKLLPNEVKSDGKPSHEFKLRDWVWFNQFTNGKITYLACKDNNGSKRFEWGKYHKVLNEYESALEAIESGSVTKEYVLETYEFNEEQIQTINNL